MKNKFHINCKELPSVKTILDNFFYDKKTGKLFNKTRRKGATHLAESGFMEVNGYRGLTFNKKRYFVHRLIWKIETEKDPMCSLDHINGKKTDNRFCNLREVSHRENMLNQKIRKTNTSGITGVCFDKAYKKWMAHITVNGKFKFLGRFENKKHAIKARKKAEKEYGYHKNHGRIQSKD